MSKEAMQMALEALEYYELPDEPNTASGAANALREALSQQGEPVACLVGIKGSAFDLPQTKRAYTYAEQPGNVAASKMGRACSEAAKQSAGDSIDRGLALLQELQTEGFGVFDLGAEYTSPQQGEPAQQEPVLKVFRGELCYKSEADDQSFGMWCQVNLEEGAVFFSAPQPAQPLSEEQEREAFEAWAAPITALAKENGTYVDVMTSLAWEAWQARAAHGITQKGTT